MKVSKLNHAVMNKKRDQIQFFSKKKQEKENGQRIVL